MDEVEYLKGGSILITSTRIEIGGQTFAVRNVGSVKVTKPGTPWIVGGLGVFVGLSAVLSQQWGMLLITAGAAAWVWQQMRTRRLVLVSGGGETVALTSTDKATVEKLRAAIAQAISAR
jgi:hypothetical protein